MRCYIVFLFSFILVNYAACAPNSSGGKATMLTLNDGNEIPVLALGTGRGTKKPTDDLELVRHSVLWAIEAGYRHIDTAEIYNDETEVGQGIADAISKGIVKREDLFVTTKLWNTNHDEAKVVPALRESLKRLNLTYVDLYLIHFPVPLKEDGSPGTADYLETWKGMEEARKLGLARSIGVSNFNQEQIHRLVSNAQVKPAVNQIEVNPTLTQEDLIKFCHDHGIKVMSYSPMGFMVTRKTQDAPPPSIDDPELVRIAKKYNKTVPQVVLRYLIDRGTIPIAKSTNRERILENISIFDFNLTCEDIDTINKFNKNVRVIKIDGWKDYPFYPFE